MGFFGMSQAGKDARGRLNDLSNWDFSQMQDWLKRGNDQMPQADYLTQQFIQRLTDMYNEGFGDPATLKALGDQIAPGLGDMLAARRQRDAATRGTAANIPNAAQTTDRMNAITDNQGRSITGNYDAKEGQINPTFSGMSGRVQSTGDQIQRNIGDTYGDARSGADTAYSDMAGRSGRAYGGAIDNTGQTFGGVRRAIGDTYGGLQGLAGDTTGQVQKILDNNLNPNSDSRMTRAARAFNPALASTASRLRRAGVDLTSPEGIAAMQRVESSRGRAIDDALGDENRAYTDASVANANRNFDMQSNLRRSQLGDTTQAALGELDRGTNLAIRGADDQNALQAAREGITRGLTLDRGAQTRDTLRRTMGDLNNIDASRLNATLQNLDTANNQTLDYFNNRRNDTMGQRQMGVQDLGIQTGLNDRDNATDQWGRDATIQNYGLGTGQRQADLGFRQNVAGQAGGVGNTMWGRGVQANQIGQGWGRDAGQGYQNIYNREAADSGWGLKMLGGLATGAMNALIPGSGAAGGFGRLGGVLRGGRSSGRGGFGGGYSPTYPN